MEASSTAAKGELVCLHGLRLECPPVAGGGDLNDAAEIALVVRAARAAADDLTQR